MYVGRAMAYVCICMNGIGMSMCKSDDGTRMNGICMSMCESDGTCVLMYESCWQLFEWHMFEYV